MQQKKTLENQLLSVLRGIRGTASVSTAGARSGETNVTLVSGVTLSSGADSVTLPKVSGLAGALDALAMFSAFSGISSSGSMGRLKCMRGASAVSRDSASYTDSLGVTNS